MKVALRRSTVQSRGPNLYNKGYEPGNVRWVTHTENNANTRRSRFVNIENEKVCVAEAARRIGMSRHELRHKLNRGIVPWTDVVIEVIE